MAGRVGISAAALCVILCAGCTTTRGSNASASFGNLRRVAVVQATGNRGAADFLVDQFARQSRAEGRFDVSDERAKALAAQSAEVAMQPLSPAHSRPDEVLLRIDVTEWASGIEEASSGSVAPAAGITPGRQIIGRIRVPRPTAVGRVGFRVTAVGPNGVVFSDQPYSARFALDGEDQRLALETAASSAIARLLSDVTPR